MNRALVNRRVSVAIVLIASGLSAPGVLGQVIPPAPPAGKPRPEWTPPAPPPPPAPTAAPERVPPPVEPIAPPDLVKRDAQGVVVILDIPQEQAAVEALALSAEQRSLLEQAKTERSALYQRFLSQNLEPALRTRAGLAQFAAGNTSGALDLVTIAKRVQVIPNFIKSMEMAGVIDARQALAASRGSDAYTAAISRDLKKMVESQDVNNQMQVITSVTVRRIAAESVREFNALLARTGEQWATLSTASALTPTDAAKFEAAQAAIARASDPVIRADSVAAALAELPPEQAKDLLSRAAPALPEKRLLPDINSALPKEGSRPSKPATKPAG